MDLEHQLRKNAARGANLKEVVMSNSWNESLGTILEEMVISYQQNSFNPDFIKDRDKYLMHCAEYNFLMKLKAIIDNTIQSGETAAEQLREENV